jgi:hypothetical protein
MLMFERKNDDVNSRGIMNREDAAEFIELVNKFANLEGDITPEEKEISEWSRKILFIIETNLFEPFLGAYEAYLNYCKSSGHSPIVKVEAKEDSVNEGLAMGVALAATGMFNGLVNTNASPLSPEELHKLENS